jgi:hypothetical protein
MRQQQQQQRGRQYRTIAWGAALMASALTLGCANDGPTRIVRPPGARHSIATLGTIHLRGFTTDFAFSRYTSSPTYFSTGDYKYYWSWGQGTDSVTVSTFGSESVPEYMYGGDIYVTAIIDGVEQELGQVSGTLADKWQIFQVPQGATIKLLAFPNSGCHFAGWKTGFGGAGSFLAGNPNPLYIAASDMTVYREGWFQC